MRHTWVRDCSVISPGNTLFLWFDIIKNRIRIHYTNKVRACFSVFWVYVCLSVCAREHTARACLLWLSGDKEARDEAAPHSPSRIF